MPVQEVRAEEKKRLGLREENLPGHLQNQQEQKEKEKQAQQEKEESLENDGQLKRALELLKGWDVFKQLVQKKAG